MTGEEIVLSIGEAAAMTGLSTETIRAWERRHHVLSPSRTGSRHRRYGLGDVEVLRRVRYNVAGRGLSLRLAVAEAHGLVIDDPASPDDPTPAVERDGGVDAPWRAVGDLFPNVICILDARGAVIDANVAWARMCGVLRMHLPGMRLLDFVEPSDRAKAARLYRPRPQSRRAWEINLLTPMLSGIFTFDSHVLPTPTSVVVVLVGRDVSASTLEEP